MMMERAFSYDFRHTDSSRLIWRIDNHGAWQSVASPCHVHADPDNEDTRIEFFSDSKKTDFTYAMHCVKSFYEGKPQDWESA
jgi:hypothetical protein